MVAINGIVVAYTFRVSKTKWANDLRMSDVVGLLNCAYKREDFLTEADLNGSNRSLLDEIQGPATMRP